MLKIAVSDDDHAQGPADAPITLVEYGDYECPHCGHAYPIVQQVQKHYGKRLRFAYRNFPLRDIHPMAEPAAEAAEFAGTVGKFWEMHDAIFETQPDLSMPALLEMADAAEIDSAALEAALSAETFAERVQTDFMGGVRSGVNGTPTFFINGHRHDGPFEFEDLVAAIEVRMMT
jgi:protein-disulfide isomerase